MKSKKTRSAITILLFAIPVILFIRGCVIPGINFFSNTNLSAEEKATKEQGAHEQYLKLFDEEAQAGLEVFDKYTIKPKHPFIIYSYARRYQILLYKVNLIHEASLNEFVLLKKQKANLSSNVTYSGLQLTHIDFYYSHDYDSLVKNIFVLFDDSLIQKHTITSNIICYDLQTTSLYFKYEPRGTNDFGFTTKGPQASPKVLPKLKMSVLFYKKGKDVFIAVMYPNDRGERSELPPLHSLVQKPRITGSPAPARTACSRRTISGT